jgi:Uma2 family endonuclease
MSTVERLRTETLPPLVAGQRLDQPMFHERYAAMPPDTRAELVGGVVYMPSPVSKDHGEIDNDVSGWLYQYKCHTPGASSPNNATVKLDRQAETQPDIQLRIPAELGGQTTLDEHHNIVGAPELIVEIARSSQAYDLGAKKADYERAGVLEYLVVTLDPDDVHWFVRRGGQFVEMSPGPDGVLRSEVFPGLWLDPQALLIEDRSRQMQILHQGIASPEHAEFVDRLARAKEGRALR